jgi:hypothetical protein
MKEARLEREVEDRRPGAIATRKEVNVMGADKTKFTERERERDVQS